MREIRVNHPVSLYAATKRSNELMAHTYSHLFNLPTTGLRFFTVYGPWGRPDMALFKFTELIFNNEMPIEIYNNGAMERSFTYIDDVIESLFRIIKLPPKADKLFLKNKPDPSQSWAPFRVFNIGNSQSSNLLEYRRKENIWAKKLLEIIFHSAWRCTINLCKY